VDLIKTIEGNGKLLCFDSIKIMGILNSTPDSFYTHNLYPEFKDKQKQINRFVQEGVDILDLGAVSTRPGATLIDAEEEWNRLKPVLEWTRKEFPDIFISIDTFRSEIVEKAFDLGINMVNDISAGKYDKNLWDTLAKYQLPYVLMHMQGDPATMQEKPHYENIQQEIMDYFLENIYKLQSKGIKDIILDPGFGFGKNKTHNYELLHNLDSFSVLNTPILVGLSRKTMLYELLGKKPDEVLNASTVVHTIAALKGATIFRVHDVDAMNDVKIIINQFKNFR